MPVCDVSLKADEEDSGDEGDGSRAQGWATEHAKAAVSGATLKAHPMIRSITSSNSLASLASICIPFIRLKSLFWRPCRRLTGRKCLTSQMLTSDESLRTAGNSRASFFLVRHRPLADPPCTKPALFVEKAIKRTQNYAEFSRRRVCFFPAKPKRQHQQIAQ
jgi:hypothetical protein